LSSDPDGDALSYSWDFGDGGSGSGPSPTHAYADNGSYTATLTVSDGNLSNAASAAVTVANVAPTATFTNTTPVNEGSPFTLTLNGATDPSPVDLTAGLQYAFDCGTGFGVFGASTSASCPTTDNGSRTVRGQVRDKDGGTTTYSATQQVRNVVPRVTITAASPRPITVGGSFSINTLFTDPGTLDNPWKVTINWGNGSTTFNSATQGTPILRTRTYATQGSFSIKVTVQDKNGGKGTSNTLTLKVN
jgi:PKD repeat protein